MALEIHTIWLRGLSTSDRTLDKSHVTFKGTYHYIGNVKVINTYGEILLVSNAVFFHKDKAGVFVDAMLHTDHPALNAIGVRVGESISDKKRLYRIDVRLRQL